MRFLALCALFLLPEVAWAQTFTDPVTDLSEALHADQRAHLWRLAAWGSTNVLSGLALVATQTRQERPGWHGFGWQSAAWGSINIGIAAIGLLNGQGELSSTFAQAIAAENTYADILLVNLGLNVGYSAIGTTMVVLSHYGVRHAQAIRGHGSALIVQGAGLFILDTIAWLGTRARFDALLDLTSNVALHVAPQGAALTLVW